MTDARREGGQERDEDKPRRKARKDAPLPRILTEACLGCGLCVLHCPAKALRLERDPAKPAPLMEAVDG